MADALSIFPLGEISAGALVALICWLILAGRLVPRQQILDLQADRDRWHKAADDWQATAAQLGGSVERLLVHAQTTAHALEEIQSAVRHGRDPS